MKTKLFTLSAICLFNSTGISAQNVNTQKLEELQKRTEKLEKVAKAFSKIKISGYIQGQFQYSEKDALTKVGAKNEDKEESYNRLGVRRGHVKFTFEEGIASAVFQLDFTEKGIGFKDAYLNLKDPWTKSNALRAGIFDRPFGYEISYSSSRRESPERSTVFQTLFPEERDLGAMLILQPQKESPLNFIKLEAGLFAGNGIKQETDNRKDFIGHISATNKIGTNFDYGLGFSYYNGGVYQSSETVYKMKGNGFEVDNNESNKGEFAKREYFGIDGRIGYKSSIGQTQLRAEYLFGQQPGIAGSSKSPNSSSLPASPANTYIRDFNGGYVMLIQSLGKLPVLAVLKYDWYDPNTDVSGNDLGLNGTSKTDRSQNTFGLGALWDATKDVRLQAYYEFNNFEESNNINDDIKANLFTLRLQYKF
ncbi:hypothetical protein D0T53_06685 [Dysgonomonas sp. 216]|uniref:hypothetical protein n=1 Tax=Dysgonomonas sp. 216 TaxID=2302934 RepID=UPI0013D5BB50|nr:hypothetical protein [Dysgonomonas sp. 216]NDW18601.1 hypothetical protein [Dysgonomonas sp. 216]